MQRREFNRQVAKATGESLSEVRTRGFQPVFVSTSDEPDPAELDRYLDWDQLEAARLDQLDQVQMDKDLSSGRAERMTAR